MFNNQCSARAGDVGDPQLAQLLSSGQAYEYATGAFVNSIADEAVRQQVIGVFESAMKLVWQVGIVFSALGFLIVFLEKEVPLREELDTQFGLKDKAKDPTAVVDEEKAVMEAAKTAS